MTNIFSQHIINFDTYTQNFFLLRKNENNSFKKINTVVEVLSFIKKYKGSHYETDEFFTFLEQIFNNNEQQRNNHTFMRTLLANRITTHRYINYDNLKNFNNFKDIPKINLPAKKIISNKFITNQTEDDLKVTSLEKEFLHHLKNNEFCLTHDDIRFNFVRDSIALHFARRENFLIETLYPQMEWHLRNQNKNEIDLLDYYYLKFFYNKALLVNYSNILKTMETNVLHYIFTYKFKTNLNYKWVDVNNNIEVNNELAEDFNFAINEQHTFFGFDFFNILNQEKNLLEINGFTEFTDEEINSLQKTIFILGDTSKILFITNNIDDNFIKKLLFIIHAKWDILMAHSAMKTLLISEKSPIFNIKFFQELRKNKNIIERNAKISQLYNISEMYENIVANYIDRKKG